MAGDLLHHTRATVAVYRDKDGDIQLSRPLTAWLSRRKDGWGAQYFGTDEEYRDTLFMFENQADARLFRKKFAS